MENWNPIKVYSKSELPKERQGAYEYLRSVIKPYSTVYTIIRHVSKSGMRREISIYALVNGQMECFDRSAALCLGYIIGKHGGIIIDGCGMDMGFHLVSSLSRHLFLMDNATGSDYFLKQRML